MIFLGLTLLALSFALLFHRLSQKGVDLRKIEEGFLEGRENSMEKTPLQRRLEQSGLSKDQDMDFMRRQILFFFSGLCLGVFLFSLGGGFFPLILLPSLLFLLPQIQLKKRIQIRQRQIFYSLPSFLDLVTLALESGMDLFHALEEVLAAGQKGPLEEEIDLLMKEVQMGTSRGQAFGNLGDRNRSECLLSLASTVRQSEEVGSNLGPLLRLQAQALRADIARDAEEEAQKAPVKILFPLLFFIFPVVLAILLGPLILTFIAST